MRPLVSILIPCFNAERWVAQAIESALGQTWPEKEVIVVDDGSTDNSLQIIKSFGPRIRWETGPNRGANIARNRLLELGRGEWLQYLDADDYLLPEKVEMQMNFVSGHPNVDVVYGPATIEHWNDGNAKRELLAIPEPHDPWILLARWYLPQTGACLWRKQAITDVGGWKADLPCCQEHELYLRLLIDEKRFGYCPRNGAVYRQWSEDTVCKRDKREVHEQRFAIERRIEEFLRAHRELTLERLWAVNQARFEVARMAWHYDPCFSCEIVKSIRESAPSFSPHGPAAPLRYRILFSVAGFRAAENLAELTRTIVAFGRRLLLSRRV